MVMRIKNIENVNDFFKVVDKCNGKVELVGDDIRLNLKSELSKYFSLAKIFSDGNKVSELEVVAYNVDDIKLLMDYMIDRNVA